MDFRHHDEMQRRTSHERLKASTGNGRPSSSKYNRGLECRDEHCKCNAICKQTYSRIGVDDGTRIWHGVGGVHNAREGGTHGMRGDGVGIRDVGAVSCGTWGRGDTSGGDDGRGAGRERKPGVVGGLRGTE